MFRPIRVDHTNCLQVAIKTHSFKGSPIQIPVTKGIVKSTNHKGNVIDVLRQTYNKPVSFDDIGINSERNAKIHSAVTELSPNISEKDDRRKKLEAQVAAL